MSYRDEVEADAPLIYLPLERTTEAIRTAGVSAGAAIIGPGASVLLDGTSGYLVVPDSSLSVSAFSLEIVFKPTSLSQPGLGVSAAPGGVLFESNESGTDNGFVWGVRQNGSFWWWPGPSLDKFSATGLVAVNSSNHALLTYGSGTLDMYLNGASVYSGTATAPASKGTSGLANIIRIGGRSWTVGYWKGLLKHAAIYGSKLSAARGLAHYNALAESHGVAGQVTVGSSMTPQRRKVFLISKASATVAAQAESDAGTGNYATTVPDRSVLYGLSFVDYGEAWAASKTMVVGARCLTRSNNGHWYECESAGTCGSTEPTWPTDGSTVVDGTVTWRDKGLVERPWAEGPYVPPP